MQDDRGSNVAGADAGGSGAPETGGTAGRELELQAGSLRAREEGRSPPDEATSGRRRRAMSTGGPDPNRSDDADPEVARGELGDPASTRYGLSSGVIVFIALCLLVFVLVISF